MAVVEYMMKKCALTKSASVCGVARWLPEPNPGYLQVELYEQALSRTSLQHHAKAVTKQPAVRVKMA